MPRFAKSALIAVALAPLAGCGVNHLVDHSRPDEFAVERQTPLVVPPDFALTPPRPGAPRAGGRTAQQDALEAMFGGPAPRSAIETSALNRSGTAEPSIRSTVADPATNTAPKGDVTRDILSAPQGDGQAASTGTTG